MSSRTKHLAAAYAPKPVKPANPSEGTASARRILLMLTLLAQLSAAQASIYMGAGVGYGDSKAPPAPRNQKFILEHRDQASGAASVFLGYRAGWWGVEVGAMRLPSYYASAYTWDYQAYSGTNKPGDPATIDLQQRVDSAALYARANLYAPELGGFTPYGFVGAAAVFNRNREWGLYDGAQPVDFRSSWRNVAPLVGVGVMRDLGELTLRAEYALIPGGVDSSWTRRRDVQMLMAAAAWEF